MNSEVIDRGSKFYFIFKGDTVKHKGIAHFFLGEVRLGFFSDNFYSPCPNYILDYSYITKNIIGNFKNDFKNKLRNDKLRNEHEKFASISGALIRDLKPTRALLVEHIQIVQIELNKVR